MHSTQVAFISHVADECYQVPNGYGAFYSSAGYEMTQPIPSTDPTMSSYDVGVELGISSPPVFGVSESIIENSLEIDNDSSFLDDEFNVKYNYSCTGFLNRNCDYQNDATTQKGTFKVDTSGGLGNQYRADFYSVSKLAYFFQNTSGSTIEIGHVEVSLKIF